MIQHATTNSDKKPDGKQMIQQMLDRQTELTAVEQFSQVHESGIPAQAKYYRDLIPMVTPGEDQQYAFEVDLDACSGCKACVVACHHLNGLDEHEAWRDVGLLIGGGSAEPVLQHVTSACHHCVEPACLDGCPVNAYDKDPITGIVKHLDDQCIGCQYCILKCPYDVPKYNKSLGIVRKCDMCSDRLSVGEAPACVQSCPNEAIRIQVVDRQDAIARGEGREFVAGAPSPDYTYPTTVFKGVNADRKDVQPADLYEVQPEHAHTSLVIMLVLTQMSVGAMLVEQFLTGLVGDGVFQLIRPIHSISAVALGLVALGAATLHLGRPLYAFRAMIGLRKSWLSREIVAFGVFAKLAAAYAGVMWFLPKHEGLGDMLGISAVVTGVVGVFSSAMIYHDTRRVFWNITMTGTKFALSMLVLGLPLACLTSLFVGMGSGEPTVQSVMQDWGYGLCVAVIVASTVKLLYEATAFVHLRDRRFTPMKRTAILMSGPLIGVTLRRFAFGILGGIVVPALLLGNQISASGASFSELFIITLVCLMVVLNLLGELSERYLFFTAVVSPKMPGGVM